MTIPRIFLRSFILCLGLIQTETQAEIVRNAAPSPGLKEADWDSIKYTWKKSEDENSTYGSPLGNNWQAAKIKGGVATEVWQLNDLLK